MRTPLKFFIIFFLVLWFAGCSESGKKDSSGTITVWHWMSDRESTFLKLAKRYEEQFHIPVTFELYAPSEAYAQKVKAAAQTGKLPDIYGILGEKWDLASFIKADYVEDLTPFLNSMEGGSAWKDKLFEKAVALNEFAAGNEYGVDPGIYGVPLDVMTIQMLYNKKLYEKAGLDPNRPPQTWDEFVAHNQALKASGIPGFVSGFGEIWMIDAFASNLAMNLMGEEKVFATYAGKVPYTDPDWIRVLSLFKQMADEGIVVEGAVTMVNKTAEQTFVNERAAYSFNGSWSVNVYKGMNPDLRYGAFLPPKPEPSHPMKVWGGAGTSFVVNKKSPRREQAVRFLRWLTEDAQQAALSAETLSLPSNKSTLSKLSSVSAEFADDMDSTTHPNVYPVHEIPPVTEAFDKGIQSILIGEKSPAAVAEEVQRVKEKETSKSYKS